MNLLSLDLLLCSPKMDNIQYEPQDLPVMKLSFFFKESCFIFKVSYFRIVFNNSRALVMSLCKTLVLCTDFQAHHYFRKSDIIVTATAAPFHQGNLNKIIAFTLPPNILSLGL